MDHVECLIVGAGVVGLAIARSLAQEGREVMVLESQAGIGMGTSSRNSEVIHAGIYYPQGSLKARLCVQGRQMLYAYCAERGVAHQRCGKLIVATSAEQVAQLDGIRAKAEGNGVLDMQWLDGAQAMAMEPALRCHAALLSPSTGIVDSHGLMLSLQGDLEHAGGLVALHTQVTRAELGVHGITVTMADGLQLHTQIVVNAAGLAAPDLASRFQGLDRVHVPTAYYAKGNYFSLAGKAPFSHLIYPVPEHAGLGVHLTLDLAGQAKFGPDVQWIEAPGDWQVDPARGEGFYEAVRSYWPGLRDGALMPAYAGVRPKISGPQEPAADFCISGPQDHGVPGLVNLFGIESPGLTSSLAIAQMVRDKLL
jgi:L-2-hydroxyglutarate oxidase LhgO